MKITLSHKKTFFRKLVWSIFYFIFSSFFLYVLIFNSNVSFLSKSLEFLMFLLTFFFGILCLQSVKVDLDDNSLNIKGFFVNYSIDLMEIKNIRRFFIYFYIIKKRDQAYFKSFIIFFATNNGMMTLTDEVKCLRNRIKINTH